MSELACYPYGVGHGQEGVCLQVQMGPHRVLLDCGLKDLNHLDAEDLQPADFVLCTHAHPDHARGILALHHKYPRLPIFASEVTTQLLPLNWLDRLDQVPADLCRALPWRTPVEVADGLTFQLWPAGHLPGAACVLLSYIDSSRTYTVFYTGDFFLSNSRLVEGLPLEELRGLKPDVLILEGSYGTARYPHRRQQENHLAEHIYHLLRAERCILLPTPTLGLGQDLVMLLRSHHQFTGKDLTVWVDPTVAAGCDMYLDLMSYFPTSVQNFARHQPLFWDERILPRVRRIPPNGEINLSTPGIVIGHRGSDLSQYCRANDLPWTVMLPESYASALAEEPTQTAMAEAPSTSEDTPSPSPSPDDNDVILDWLQSLSQELESGRVQIETYLLTSHSDGTGTTQLIHNLRPQHVVFVHGRPNYLADLASLEELQNRYQLHLPYAGNRVEMPISANFIQPAAPDLTYQGEITETLEGIALNLPDDVTLDPRWRQFADTGVVQVRWQGENLVIQSISQRELLSGNMQNLVGSSEQESCQHCVHQNRQRCWNPRSPLYQFKVAPDGYCPEFEVDLSASAADDSSNESR